MFRALRLNRSISIACDVDIALKRALHISPKMTQLIKYKAIYMGCRSPKLPNRLKIAALKQFPALACDLPKRT
jgi:hypothetical protein